MTELVDARKNTDCRAELLPLECCTNERQPGPDRTFPELQRLLMEFAGVGLRNHADRVCKDASGDVTFRMQWLREAASNTESA